MQVTGLDHVVLNVADAEASVRWYGRLGLQSVRLEEWRRGEAPFVSLRVDDTTIIDLQQRERTGENLDHVCLTVDDSVDIDAPGRLRRLRGGAGTPPALRRGGAGAGASTCGIRTGTWSSYATTGWSPRGPRARLAALRALGSVG